MLNLLRLCLCLLPLLPLAQAQCSQFSVAECQPDPDEVIREISLPGDQGASYSQVCQELCGIEEGCNHWSYDQASLTCSLLSYCYITSCDSIMAGPQPDFKDCLCQNSDRCNGNNAMVQENCDFFGNVLWQSDAISDASQCQEFLQLLGPVYGGQMFSFNHSSHTCSILDTGDRDCSILSGPREQCDSATPSTSTTARIATVTTTSGKMWEKNDIKSHFKNIISHFWYHHIFDINIE